MIRRALKLLVLSLPLLLWTRPAEVFAQGPDSSIGSVLAGEQKLSTPTSLVLFGSTGDLASRKLFPSLYKLHSQGLLGKNFQIVAAARNPGSTGAYLSKLRTRVAALGGVDTKSKSWAAFERIIIPRKVDFAAPESLQGLKKHLGKRPGVFYLALPPVAFDSAVTALSKSKLIGNSGSAARNRIVFEKPFGSDHKRSAKLSRAVKNAVSESRVLRMDHYLGKQAVLELMAMRFVDKGLEPTWNRKYISKVEISASEKIDIQGRGKFYDQTGTLRDFVQGHLMQVLSVVAMDAPNKSNNLQQARAAALAKVKPVDPASVVRGQYRGYQKSPGVKPGSTTETYVALEARLSGARWSGVPFVLESGKALSEKRAQVKVHFRSLEASVAQKLGLPANQPAVLTIAIDPNPKMEIRSGKKRVVLGSKALKINRRQPYERLLLAAVTGKGGLFAGAREIAASWKILNPVEKAWRKSGKKPFLYNKGSKRPAAAGSLFAKEKRKKVSSPMQHLARQHRQKVRMKRAVRANPLHSKTRVAPPRTLRQ